MKTGAEVQAEIVRQMREITRSVDFLGFEEIIIGHEDFELYQTHFEDTGANPVMKRRDLIGKRGSMYHGTPITIKDQSEQPEIKVVGKYVWWNK